MSIQGEIALPHNPNCVLYAVNLERAMAVGWRTIQRAAWLGLEQFYSSSGIDTAAYVGRRAWLDRRNHPENQLLLMFVIDGPASSEDLALLEAAVHRSPLPWSKRSMESMPPDAFATLVVKSGKMYQIWTPIEGVPKYLAFGNIDGRIAVIGSTSDQVSSKEFLPYVRHVVGARRTVRDEDWRMERMRIAFAHYFSRRIVDADGVVHADEREFMNRVFPTEVMSDMGMDDPEAYAVALAEALEELPALLGYHDKLAMVGLFFSVCHADGKLVSTEMKVLKEAATVLGLEGNEVVGYLTKMW